VAKLSKWPTELPASKVILNERHSIITVTEQLVSIFVARCHDSVDSDVIRMWLAAAADGGQWITNVALSAKGLEHQASEAISDVVIKCRANHLGGFSGTEFSSAYFVEELTRVSRAVEEGKGATGTIAFVATDGPKKREVNDTSETQISEEMDKLAEFDKSIRLNDHKHIVKSLQLVKSESAGCLWGDQDGLYGIIQQPPIDSLVARFSRGIADLSYAGTKICRIVGGEASYILKEPRDLLAPLLGCGEDCLDTVSSIIESCRSQRHGATLVLVPEVPKFAMTGHKLKLPIKKPRNLMGLMSSVDGAILLDSESNLHGYGFILDGDADPDSERLSRGARFNSALRFSRRIPEGFVLVISEDGPLTLFRYGSLLYADPLSEVDPSRKPHKDITDGMDLTTWTVLPHARASKSGKMTLDGPEGKQTVTWDHIRHD
jgi:DisA bacterial checkpoint controller nucleotide-binding.